MNIRGTLCPRTRSGSARAVTALAEPGSTTRPPMGHFRFHALATRDTLTRTFAPEDGGKMAFYQLRWVSTRGGEGAVE